MSTLSPLCNLQNAPIYHRLRPYPKPRHQPTLLRGLKLRFLLTVFCTSFRGLMRVRAGMTALWDGE